MTGALPRVSALYLRVKCDQYQGNPRGHLGLARRAHPASRVRGARNVKSPCKPQHWFVCICFPMLLLTLLPPETHSSVQMRLFFRVLQQEQACRTTLESPSTFCRLRGGGQIRSCSRLVGCGCRDVQGHRGSRSRSPRRQRLQGHPRTSRWS